MMVFISEALLIKSHFQSLRNKRWNTGTYDALHT